RFLRAWRTSTSLARSTPFVSLVDPATARSCTTSSSTRLHLSSRTEAHQDSAAPSLRGWSHCTIQQVLDGGSGARSDGSAALGERLAVGSDSFDCCEATAGAKLRRGHVMAGNILLGIGAVAVAIGYFRKSRNVMLLGAIVLVLGAGFENLVRGL